ncbi:MAG: hypothetical protein H6832_05080 [Planctomycetes bacterium]|nr:hypothetical protein [Planctomycetota bacterium]MCB9890513.1 hypothetical protein [Planctomycetota bacterium]MCB9917754.1 hypothetical protein [Planctomycetota bacterium]
MKTLSTSPFWSVASPRRLLAVSVLLPAVALPSLAGAARSQVALDDVTNQVMSRVSTTSRDLAALFPRDSFLVVETGGLERAKHAVRDTRLHRVLAEAAKNCDIDLGAILSERLREELGGDSAELAGVLNAVGLEVGDIRTLLERPMAIGVGRPSLRSLMTPSIVFAVDVRGHEDRVRDILERMESKLPHVLDHMAGVQATWSSPRVGDLRLRCLDIDTVGFRISYTMHDGVLLIGTGQGYLESVAHTMDSQQGSLREQAALQLERAHGQKEDAGPVMMRCVVNAEPLARALAPLAPYDTQELLDAIGLQRIHGAAWTSRLAQERSADVLSIAFDGADSGLLKSVFSKKTTALGAPFCSPSTFAYFDVSVNRDAAWQSCLAIADALPPGVISEISSGSRGGVDQLLKRADKRLSRLGLSIADLTDLLSSVGDEISFSVDLHRQLPEVLVFARLRGDASLAKRHLVSKLESLCTGEQLPKLRYSKTRDYWFVSVRTSAMSLTPSIAFRDDVVILSPYKNVLSEALVRFDESQPSLASDARFEPVGKRSDATVRSYIAYGEALHAYWPIVRGALSQGVQEAGGNDQGLPSEDELADALGVYWGVLVSDAAGYTSIGEDPLGFATLFGYASLVIDVALDHIGGRAN